MAECHRLVVADGQLQSFSSRVRAWWSREELLSSLHRWSADTQGALDRSICWTRQRHSWVWKLNTNGKTSYHLSWDLDFLWGLVNLPNAGLSTILSRALCWASRHLLFSIFHFQDNPDGQISPLPCSAHAQTCIQSQTACPSRVSVAVAALPWWEGFQTHFLCFPRVSVATSLHNYSQRRKCCCFFSQQSYQVSFFSAVVLHTFILNTSVKSLLINTSLTARRGRCLVLGERDFTRTLFTFHLGLTPAWFLWFWGSCSHFTSPHQPQGLQ